MNEASSFPTSHVSPRPTFSGPRTFGEILDRTFQLLRSNLRLFLAIVSVPVGALLALYVIMFGGLALSGALAHPVKTSVPWPGFGGFFAAALIACIPVMMVFALFLAAACYAAAEADAGVKVTFREAYGLAWRQKGRHIGLLFWIYFRAFFPALIVFGLMASIGGLFSFTPVLHPGPALFLLPLGMLLYFAAYVYGIVVVLRLSLAFPACVVEGVTARVAMQRSSLLTQGAKGRIFLMLLVIHVICYVFFLAFYLISAVLIAIGVFLSITMHLHLAPPWSFIGLGLAGVCVAIVMFLAIALTWSGLTTAIAVLYNDQRVRKEGYDIERMMHAAGLSAPVESAGGAGLVAGGEPGEPAQ